jgi:hypothetical protein
VPFGQHLNVELQARQRGEATLQLLDALGRELRQQPVQLTGQLQRLELSTDALSAGLYTLRLTLADGSSQVLKVVK